MTTALLAALALGQTIPETASVIYPGVPSANAGTSVEMVTHGATYKLDVRAVSFESLSTLRNTSDKPATLTLQIPVGGKNVTWDQDKGLRLAVQVNRQTVAAPLGQIVGTNPSGRAKENGIWKATYQRTATLKLTFRARETKSLQVSFKAPIGKAGLDAAQRMVVYDTDGAGSWASPVGQFNFAIQDPRGVVLQVFAALPEGRWQIGRSGAFWKRNGYTPPEKSNLIFTYYPNTLERIGEGGAPSDPPR